MRLLRIFLLTLCIALPTHAQEKAFPGKPAPSVESLLNPKAVPQTLQDHANIYYERCLHKTPAESLKPYIEMQCACTAASYTEVLSLSQAQRITQGDRQSSLYPLERLMMLGYSPCMSNTAKQISFDTCMDTAREQRVPGPVKFCECVARNIRTYVDKYGYLMIPGMRRGGYTPPSDPKEATGLEKVLESVGYAQQTQYLMASCRYNSRFVSR